MYIVTFKVFLKVADATGVDEDPEKVDQMTEGKSDIE